MKPEEFIARMIDAFAPFEMGSFGGCWPNSFSSAATCISHQPLTRLAREMNGYIWSLWSDLVLDHCVIKASLTDGSSDLTATLCFNTQQSGVSVPLLATWHHAGMQPSDAEGPMCMLTMLTLKTSYRIRDVHQ